MNGAANVILLPPPGAKRFGPEGMDGSRRFKPAAADTTGRGFDAEQLAGLVDALARQGKESPRKRGFADELYGESGRAPADLGFHAQRYAQETMHMAAHHEDWRQGTEAYGRAQNLTETTRGTFVAA